MSNCPYCQKELIVLCNENILTKEEWEKYQKEQNQINIIKNELATFSKSKKVNWLIKKKYSTCSILSFIATIWVYFDMLFFGLYLPKPWESFLPETAITLIALILFFGPLIGIGIIYDRYENKVNKKIKLLFLEENPQYKQRVEEM